MGAQWPSSQDTIIITVIKSVIVMIIIIILPLALPPSPVTQHHLTLIHLLSLNEAEHTEVCNTTNWGQTFLKPAWSTSCQASTLQGFKRISYESKRKRLNTPQNCLMLWLSSKSGFNKSTSRLVRMHLWNKWSRTRCYYIIQITSEELAGPCRSVQVKTDIKNCLQMFEIWLQFASYCTY